MLFQKYNFRIYSSNNLPNYSAASSEWLRDFPFHQRYLPHLLQHRPLMQLESFSLIFISLTPCVALPITLRLLTGILRILPAWVIIMRSFWSADILKGDQFSGLFGHIYGLHSFSAPVGDSVVGYRRSLPVAILGNNQDIFRFIAVRLSFR